MFGIFLYGYEYWWMFFCVLISGFLEFLLDWPAMFLPDNIKTDWIFSKADEQKQKKQIKTLLLLVIITNILLIILNSYPFILQSPQITPYPYEGGVLVTLMTIFLYFMNGSLIYENVKVLKNIDKLFEKNINRFIGLQNFKDTSNEKGYPQTQVNNSPKIVINSTEHLQEYIDRCNSNQISIEVIKANIRILNAMTDSYKKGYAELSYKIIEQQLEEKISLAKRDFVKRECRLAFDILNMLKTRSIEDVITALKQKYPYSV